MTCSNLDNLPNEILYQIGNHLKSRSRDLRHLGLVNKHLNLIANEFLYCSIDLTFHDPSMLPGQLALIERVAPHVRKLVLLTHLWATPQLGSNVFHPDQLRFSCWCQETNAVRGAHLHQVLKPVAELISKLPALTDLVYSCEGYLPPCLYGSLKTKPACHLHFTSFRFMALEATRQRMVPFASMIGNMGAALRLDAHMLDVLKLPNLTSICISSGGLLDSEFAITASKYIIKKLANSLKNVQIVDETSPFILLSSTFQACWQDFVANDQDCVDFNTAGRPVRLENLHLTYMPASENDVPSWFDLVDSTKLLSLELQLHHPSAMRYLSNQCHFQSLRSLSIRIGTIFTDSPEHLDLEYEFALIDFLISLQRTPLTNLRIEGPVSQAVMSVILTNLGSQLKRFHLLQNHSSITGEIEFSESVVRRIGDHCPQLVELLCRPQNGNIYLNQEEFVYERGSDGLLHSDVPVVVSDGIEMLG